jgi:hypothetical protein
LPDLALAVARALPGLWGYVGLDVIMTGTNLTVVDVNPRLTTAYVGLRKLLDTNLAAAVLDLLNPAQPITAVRSPIGSMLVDLRERISAPLERDVLPSYTPAAVS